MRDVNFMTRDGRIVPAVTAEQMREVDWLAVEKFGLGILQMMENAGRNLALNAIEMLPKRLGKIMILAGPGGNGGGGLCCARHLLNRGYPVHVFLSQGAATLTGTVRSQLRVLLATGLRLMNPSEIDGSLRQSDLVVDALVGYSLRGAPRGQIADFIQACNQYSARVLSLDVPSGLDATTGETPGVCIRPDRTLTLALPKTGLQQVPGELFVADIGIPPQVYKPLEIDLDPFFGQEFYIPLKVAEK